MTRIVHMFIFTLLAFLLAACSPSYEFIVTVAPEMQNTEAQASPTASSEGEAGETSLPQTETPLPPLELPTLEAGLPPIETWDGQPTYLAESAPDTYFRVNYNPHLWAKTEDQFGQVVLAHRSIPYCVITPATGRGLPQNFNIVREMRTLGAIEYEVNLAYQDEAPQFAAYYGGTPGELYTGFQVSFQEQFEICLGEAEAVLATLRAVPLAEATPGQ